MKFLRRSVFLALIGVSVVAPGLAQTQQGEQASPKSDRPAAAWTTRCTGTDRSKSLDCAIEQRAVLTATGQLVSAVTVRLPSDSRKPVLMIQVPVGLFLPAGLTVSIDDAPVETFPLQTCDLNGCYAGNPVSDALLSAMKRGSTMTIRFQDLAKKEIAVPMPLTGFTAAYASIE